MTASSSRSTWDEAFATIEAGLLPLLAEHGRDACAIYLGNPGAHSMAPLLYSRTLLTALGTRNRFSASTVDQRPKEMSAAMMFGSVTVPVPDLDRTDFLLMLGANPYASNGSLCTAPDFPAAWNAFRSAAARWSSSIRAGARPPRRPSEHIAIRPGTDAHLLAAIATTLVAEGLAESGRLAEHSNGLSDVVGRAGAVHARVGGRRRAASTPSDPHARPRIRRRAPTAAVYGRIGTCTQEFGTLASWLVDIVNLLSGNLDRVGGAMFPTGATGPAVDQGRPGSGRGKNFGRPRAAGRAARRKSFGEFPVAALAEEIETPGDGQVRALVTVAGNPVASNPNSDRLDAAMASLEFMVSIDPYINETTRHADVILPPPPRSQKSHYDLALLNFAVHNVANYSPACPSARRRAA